MRNPYEPPHMSADYSKRHLRRPILIGLAMLFGILALLMALPFCWGLILFLTTAEFVEGPIFIIIGSGFVGSFSFCLSLILFGLAMRKGA